MTRPIAAGAAALALALGAACGGDDEPEAPPTAELAPPDAVLFGDGVVRPQGDQRDQVDEDLSKLLDTDDPGGFLAEQLDNLLDDEDAGITYSEDIEPWLGEHSAFFVSSIKGDGDAALVSEVTDQAAAQAAIDRVEAKQEAKTENATYMGVEYQVAEEGGAFGFVDSFLVVGTESGFRGAVDASEGESLSDDGAFRDRLSASPDSAVATLYVDAPLLVEEYFGGLEVDVDMLRRGLGPAANGPALASVAAEPDRITTQVETAAGEDSTASSDLLPQLPAESWLAFGIAASDQFARALEYPLGFSGPKRVDKIRALLGVAPKRLTRLVGAAGGYIGGTSILEIGGALMFETTDETASANALGAIGRRLGRERSLRIGPPVDGNPGFTVQLSGIPIAIVVTQRDGRVVAGLGEGSVEEALDADAPLRDSEAFGAATDALGSDDPPALFLDFPSMLELFEATGATDGDPEYDAAEPYLDHLDYLVVGGHSDGDVDVTRAVLGLR